MSIVRRSSWFLFSLNCGLCLPLNGSVMPFHLSEALGRLPHNSLVAVVRTENVLSELPFPCRVLSLSGCVMTIHRKRVETPGWQRQKLQQMGSRWNLGKGREHRIGWLWSHELLPWTIAMTYLQSAVSSGPHRKESWVWTLRRTLSFCSPPRWPNLLRRGPEHSWSDSP